MKRLVSFVTALLLALALFIPQSAMQAAATPLVAGDIAIIAFNYDDADQFAFVLLRDVGSGTQITFTDNGWRNTNVFRAGEGSFTWTASTNLAAGTVVRPTLSGVSFSADGDQILAYQGSSSAPTFIYALNSEGAGVWQSDATSANTSKLPSGLVNGTSAIAHNEIDNAKYVGITSGTRAQLLAAIGNPANWVGSDTTRQTMPTVAFTVSSGATNTPTATNTATPTATNTATRTPTNTATSTPTNTPTNTPTSTPTNTATSLPTNTATATSTPAAPGCPAATITGISTIQGAGLTSALTGSAVTIRGKVVGDYQGTTELKGFFVQDAGDGDPATSDGMFISSTLAVNLGDAVQLSGVVAEYFTRTQISTVSSLTVCGVAPTITPAIITLPVAAATDLEKYEGMLVTFNQTLIVNDTYTLGRYGELALAPERLWQPTNVTTPGSAALALQAQNNLKRILLDDGSTVQNTDPIKYPGTGLTAANTVRVGDTINGLTGVLDYAYSLYRIQPVGAVNFTASNPRSATPAAVGGTLRAASANVLNYFNGPTFPTSRGASTSAEFTRQRAKIINGLLALNADVIGLMEMENDGFGSTSAIQDLVNGLNAAAPSGTTYAFINPGVAQVGTDEITVGILYRIQTVQPVGAAAIKTTGAFASLNRPPMAQTFQFLSTGGKFTLVVNHFKSKGSACTGDPDTGDGQGNCNLTRVAAANDLTSWLATDPTASGDADYLIVGDLNSYAQEDPITAIKNAGYTNLIESYHGLSAYSYVFSGQSGYLDHALASASLAAQVTGALEWHINADEPIALDYNVEFKSAGQVTSLYSPEPYRASDHDPVLIGMTLNP